MKYRNISKNTLTLIGVGVFNPDEVFETEKDINNPNFIRVVEFNEVQVDKKEGKTKVKIEK